MTLRPRLLLAAMICACRPAVPPVSVASHSVAVPDTAASAPTPSGREQARHVLALGDEGFVVAGRRMASDSWGGVIGAWVARFDGSGRLVWSVEDTTEEGTTAELAAWDPDGGVFVLGRSSSPASLWVRSYAVDGALRWEQRFGNATESAVGFGATERGVWVLVRRLGDADVQALHVSADSIGDETTALGADGRDSVDTGPALATRHGEFYFPETGTVIRAASVVEAEWDLEFVISEVAERFEVAADAQAVLTGPLEVDTVSRANGQAVTIVQDGRTFALIPGNAMEHAPASAWGLPWGDADEAHTALAWFSGVSAGELDGALSGESRLLALEVLLSGDVSDDEPVMIPTGCNDYDEVPLGEFVPVGREHDALLGALIEDASAATVRRYEAPLLEKIEQLPEYHPLGDSFVASLGSHRVPEIAVALGMNESGSYQDDALQWLEAGGHRGHLASMAAELYDAGDACEFVAEIRAAQVRLGGSVSPPKTAGFADACDQLYELCATGSGDTSGMISEQGYRHVETCSDDFPTDPEDDYALIVEPCEPVDETRHEVVDDLLCEDMLTRCSSDTVSWGEYDPQGNCGVAVENDVHAVEFVDSGGGRWVLSQHQVDWSVE